jgi:hypothetical protein
LSSEDDLARVFAGASLGEKITPEEEEKPSLNEATHHGLSELRHR